MPVQEGHGLGTGDDLVRAEIVPSGAVGDTVGHGPGHSIGIVGVGSHIVKAGAGHHRGTGSPPLEGDSLSTGHIHVGAERGGAGAVGHAVGHSPQHRVIVVVAGAHIGKGVGTGGLGGAMSSPQEGHHLSTGDGHIGAEGGGAGAIGHAVLDRPQHGVIIVVTLIDISEGVSWFFWHLAAWNDCEGGQVADTLHRDGVAADAVGSVILLGAVGQDV